MNEINSSGDSQELNLSRKKRILAVVAGKTTFEEKRRAIKGAYLNRVALHLWNLGYPIYVYLQSCDRPQSSREICNFFKLPATSNRRVRLVCQIMILMDEIRGEKIGDTCYFSKKVGI